MVFVRRIIQRNYSLRLHSVDVDRRTIGYIMWFIALLLSLAWLIESLTVGRGFVSTYLAPIAIAGNIASPFVIGHTSRSRWPLVIGAAAGAVAVIVALGLWVAHRN
jgi:hypothetical protein